MRTPNKPNDITFGCGRKAPLDEIIMIIAACPDKATAITTIIARYRVPGSDAHAVVTQPLWTLFRNNAAS